MYEFDDDMFKSYNVCFCLRRSYF